MPNHVTNRIKITGDPDTVKRVMDAVKNESGIGTIDFERSFLSLKIFIGVVSVGRNLSSTAKTTGTTGV